MAKSSTVAAYQYLCKILYNQRLKKNLSQRELAKIMKTNQSYICKVETYFRKLNPVDLVIYARALDLDPSEIVKEIEDFMNNNQANS